VASVVRPPVMSTVPFGNRVAVPPKRPCAGAPAVAAKLPGSSVTVASVLADSPAALVAVSVKVVVAVIVLPLIALPEVRPDVRVLPSKSVAVQVAQKFGVREKLALVVELCFTTEAGAARFRPVAGLSATVTVTVVVAGVPPLALTVSV